jgi:AraC family transcriptional regulator
LIPIEAFLLASKQGVVMDLKKTMARDEVGECDGSHAILRGAALYDESLQLSGGRRIDANSFFRRNELCVALYESPPFDLHVAAVDVPRLTINLADAPVAGAMASDRSQEYAARRYSLFFTPSRCDAHWVKSKCSRHLNIYFHDGLIDEFAREQGAMRLDRPVLNMHMRRIKPWIDALELTVNQSGPHAYDASVALAHLIVAELARTPNRGDHGLNPRTLSKVREYTSAHLSEAIHVSDLAALAGMSIGRFALSFRASTGLTPHRYILQERIEAVGRLLSEQQYTLADVALRCGFSSQQHMASVMKKIAGVTPSGVRRLNTAANAATVVVESQPSRVLVLGPDGL